MKKKKVGALQKKEKVKAMQSGFFLTMLKS